MAVTVFKQSPLKAFTQSALKARGLGGAVNPTEEGQIIYYHTSAISRARADDFTIFADSIPSVQADPGFANNSVKGQGFGIFPVLPYAGTSSVLIHPSPPFGTFYPPDPRAAGWSGSLLPNNDLNGGFAPGSPPHGSQGTLDALFPPGPNTTSDGTTFPSQIQRGSAVQWSLWIYTSSLTADSTGIPFWTNEIHAQRARFRINSSQIAFFASFELWALGSDNFPSARPPGSLGWDRSFDPNALPKPVTVIYPPYHRGGYVVRNMKFLSSFSISPFMYVEVPFPEDWSYGGEFLNGLLGKGVLCAYGETIEQFSARTGIAHT